MTVAPSTLTKADFARARKQLGEDRAGFIAAAPSIGIAKSVAAKAFGAPRDLKVCLSILNELEAQTLAGKLTQPVLLIALEKQEAFDRLTPELRRGLRVLGAA